MFRCEIRWQATRLHPHRSHLLAPARPRSRELDLSFLSFSPRLTVLSSRSQTTANPSRFLLSDHIFSTAASSSADALTPPFADLSTDRKQKGKEVAPPHPEGVNLDDFLLLGAMAGVESLMSRVCDVYGESQSPPSLGMSAKNSPVLSARPEIAEDTTAFRLSEKLLVAYLRKKVARLSKQATFDRFPSLTRGLAKDGLGELTAEGNVDALTKDAKKAEDLLALKAGSSLSYFSSVSSRYYELTRFVFARLTEARLSQSLTLLKPYLSPSHYTILSSSYASSSDSQPFPLLAKHLNSLVPVLPPMLPLASTSSGGSAAGAAGAKKRKVTQGVAKLAKVDTKGMKTMDSFFKKRVVEEKGEKGGGAVGIAVSVAKE